MENKRQVRNVVVVVFLLFSTKPRLLFSLLGHRVTCSGCGILKERDSWICLGELSPSVWDTAIREFTFFFVSVNPNISNVFLYSTLSSLAATTDTHSVEKKLTISEL